MLPHFGARRGPALCGSWGKIARMKNGWQTMPDGLQAAEGWVDVWLTSTRLAEERVAAYGASLSESERARAEKIALASKRQEFVVARGLLRQMLSRVAGLTAAERGLEFQQDGRGKPGLAGGGPIAFNLSHSQGLALAALTIGGNVGVDLEQIRPEGDWQALARRFFTAAESRAIDACSPARRARAFFACWTRKEAFVKAAGSGIAEGFKACAVSVDPDEPARLLRPGPAEVGSGAEGAAWWLTDLPAPAGYAAALACRPACRLRLWSPPLGDP